MQNALIGAVGDTTIADLCGQAVGQNNGQNSGEDKGDFTI
jgi:hypothetical protein